MIRRAEPSDAVACAAIAHAAYQRYVPLIGRPPAPMVADFPRHIVDDTVFVFDDGKVKGYVVLQEQADGAWLDNIAVDPAYHGEGIGGALIREAENFFRQRGYTNYHLYTNIVMKENISLYAYLGFRETGRRTVKGFNRVYFEKALA